MRVTWWMRVGVLAAVVVTAGALDSFAQDPGQDPAPPATPSEKKPPPKKNKDNATESAEDQPTWNPQRAEKDIEVGQYYMRKGDVDAAIDRFTDATVAKPGYAVPFK